MIIREKKFLLFTVFILIAAVCFAAYASSFQNPFLWDDEGLIVKNQFIRQLSSWQKIFTSDLYTASLAGSNFYRPVQTLSFILDYHFWQLNPFGYHLTNVLLQIVVAFLVFLLVLTILGNFSISLAASLLFAVSPIHCEAVTYISGRADMLMAVFLLSSLLVFVRSLEIKSGVKYVWLVISLFLFVLGLLSKELAGVFPFVITAWVVYFNREELKKPFFFIRNIFPFFVLLLVYLALRLTVLRFATMYEPQLAKFPLFVRLEAFPLVLWTYLNMMIFPVGLHMSRTLILAQSAFGKVLMFAGFCVIWLSVFYIVLSKKNKGTVAFFVFLFFIFLLPQSGILPINAFVSDHFIYLSSVSFFVLVAYLLKHYFKKPVFIILVSFLVLFYALLTFGRNFEWRSQQVFFERIIKFSPASYLAHNNLGLEYEKKKEYLKATDEFKKAIECKPKMIIARSNLASLYYKMKKFSEAEVEYKVLEKMVPADKAGELQNNIGALYDAQGLFDRAVSRYKLALLLNPSLNLVHFNLARVYLKEGQQNLAEEEIVSSFSKVNGLALNTAKVNIVRDYLGQAKDLSCAVTFYNDLGIKFAQAKEFVLAEYCFSQAIKIAPDYADAHFNLGLAYLQQSHLKEALSEFDKALRLNPAHNKAKEIIKSLSR
ncbi:MAG: tetratricopeptide repeat protein [Candidatus Omnitrophica bacterium]|nr:tetratricopeptide repeat protein [Candidatus Omnitrophota bacterium]